MSLSNLPPELILHVFKSFDKFSHAAALSQTSHHLSTIWGYNLTSICDAILPRIIECYDQAHQLWVAQEEPYVVARHSSVEGKAEDEAKTTGVRAYIAVSRAKTLFANHDYSDVMVRKFGRLFSVVHMRRQRALRGCVNRCECWDCMTASEDEELEPRTRTHFLQGHYRVLSIMHLGGVDRADIYHVVASMSLLDFFRLLEIAEWMIYRDCWYRKWFSTGYRVLASLEIDLVKISGVARPMDEFRAQEPSCLLIFDEDCVRDNADKAKRVALANLLPLIPGNNTLDARNDLVLPDWLQTSIAWL